MAGHEVKKNLYWCTDCLLTSHGFEMGKSCNNQMLKNFGPNRYTSSKFSKIYHDRSNIKQKKTMKNSSR